MRKLAWAALPFAAAIFLAEYLLPVKGLPYLSAAFLLVSPLAFRWKGKTRKKALILLAASALGFGWFFAFYHLRVQKCEALAGQDVTVQARVIAYPYETDDYSRVDVILTDPSLPRVKAALFLYEGQLPELEPGDEIEAELRMAREPLRQADRNIYLRGYIQDESLTVTGRWEYWWLSFPTRLAHGLSRLCDEIFPDFAAPYIKGILTGDTADLKQDGSAYTDLRLSGMAHVVAVSGMHLSFLVSLTGIVLGRGRRASAVGLGLIVLFVFLAGATPSVVRAGFLNGMLLLAPLLDRERDGLTSLAAALSILLLINPKAAGSLSLQLSFAAAAGLELFYPLTEKWRRRFGKRSLFGAVAGSFGCTVGASVFTVPLSALYFGTVPLLSPVSNLLTLWMVEIIFCGGFLLCLLALLLPAAAALLAWVPAGLVWICRTVYGFVASLRGACLYTDNPAVWLWLIFVYAIFAAFYYLRGSKRRFRPLIPASLSVMALCLVLLGTWLLGPRGSYAAALDVGQGSCTVLLCGGAVTVVDCGGSGADNAGDTAANYILSRGQQDVDLLVLTHLHEDHSGGAVELMRRIKVRCLVLPADAEDEDGVRSELLAAAEQAGTEVIEADGAFAMQVGDMQLQLHLPQPGEKENERGLAVRADMNGKSIVITGDMDMEGEMKLTASGYLDKAAVYIVGHHGSRYSSSHYMLRVLQPETAIISVGSNSYGHPHNDTIERLMAWCNDIRRTDREGNITIRID